MLRVLVAIAALITLECVADGSDRQFVSPSPDGRFEVVFDQMTSPPLLIRDMSTNKPMMSMDEDRFCGRGAAVSWAPDSTKLVILVHCRLADFMHVCRLNTISIPYFQRTEGPQLPEDRVTLGIWTNATALTVKGEKKDYSLKITDERAAFTR
jgi:hypothetical protein